MHAWKIDLAACVEDTPEIQPWLDRNGYGFCVSVETPGDYEKVRDWLRNDTLLGSRRLIRTRYEDEEESFEELMVLMDNHEDADRFDSKWCEKPEEAATWGDLIITFI